MDSSVDPLDGFRGRNRDEYESSEDELRAIHALVNDPQDMDLLRQVIQSDQLMAAIKGDGVLSRLVHHVCEHLDEARKAWESDADPGSPRARQAHINARAARLVLNWIDFELKAGAGAEQLLEVGYAEEG